MQIMQRLQKKKKKKKKKKENFSKRAIQLANVNKVYHYYIP